MAARQTSPKYKNACVKFQSNQRKNLLFANTNMAALTSQKNAWHYQVHAVRSSVLYALVGFTLDYPCLSWSKEPLKEQAALAYRSSRPGILCADIKQVVE